MKNAGQNIKSILFATAIMAPVLCLNQTANAADMLEDGGPALTEVEFGTGWYLRGDVGSTIKSPSTGINTSTFSGQQQEYGQATSFGLGGGYTYKNFLRAELGVNNYVGFTYAATSGDFDCGTYTSSGVVINDNGRCRRDTTAKVSTTGFLANVYLDGPKLWRLTPYVGVGGGVTLSSWQDYRNDYTCFGVSQADCRGNGLGPHLLREIEAAETTSFALTYALMAGGSYDISKNLKLDVGYRYSNTGGTTISQAADNRFQSEDTTTGDIEIHEVRVGLRYEIW